MKHDLKLTDAELRELDDVAPVKRDNSHLAAKYNGTNSAIIAAGVKGEIKLVDVRANLWFFTAANGEKFRVTEPEGGIDSLFDIEFKRKDV